MSKQEEKTIAIVDDDPSMLRATETLLNALGFSTLVFSSAEQFLARKTKAKIGCLLLDINLGGMSGIELRQQLAASGDNFPIIFMTGLEDEAARRQAIKGGCVAYLRKPVPTGKLVEAINSAVH